MGACVSVDPPMAKIGSKVIGTAEFMKIKTYGDALRIAGYPVQDDMDVQVFREEYVIITKANTKFEFADAIRFKGNTVQVKKLYGKQNGSKSSQKSRGR